MRRRHFSISLFAQEKDRAMNEAERDNKERNTVIAENERAQQVSGDVRVSTWAIAVTALVVLAVFGWMMVR